MRHTPRPANNPGRDYYEHSTDITELMRLRIRSSPSPPKGEEHQPFSPPKGWNILHVPATRPNSLSIIHRPLPTASQGII